jgi:hypothetical protein
MNTCFLNKGTFMGSFVKIITFLLCIAFLNGCDRQIEKENSVQILPTPVKEADSGNIGQLPVKEANSSEISQSPDKSTENQNDEIHVITSVSWKLVLYSSNFYHLYVTVNKETDYYAGYYYGAGFEINEGVPAEHENVLASLLSFATGDEHWFYLYQKSESSLALMHRFVPFGSRNCYEYEEIMVIPVEKESIIQIAEPEVTEYMYSWFDDYAMIVYDGILVGGLSFTEGFISVSDYNFILFYILFGDRGFRLIDEGEYIGTVAFSGIEDEWLNGDRKYIDLRYDGEPFKGLGMNIDLIVRYCKKNYLDTSEQIYREYIAQILAENGLEGEEVNITEIIKADVTKEGADEVLVTANNIGSQSAAKGRYSICVLCRNTEAGVEFCFLEKNISADLSADLSSNSIYEYEVCEMVDFNDRGDTCEVLIKGKSKESTVYRLYEYVEGEDDCCFVMRTERLV